MRYPIAAFCILSMVVISALLHVPSGEYTKIEIEFWGGKEQNAHDAETAFALSGQPELLYLDPGDAPYFFKAKSACRYLCSLPVQRDSPDWNISTLDAYKQDYNCIMNYTGDYIVSDYKWFNASYHPEIKNKIDSEYTKVWNRSWDVYKRNV